MTCGLTGVLPAQGRDASHQSLQPTCCHEYPQEHAIPELRDFSPMSLTALTAGPARWEAQPSLQCRLRECRVAIAGELRPRIARQLVLSRPAAIGAPPWIGYAVSRKVTAAGLFSLQRARRSESLTFPVAFGSLSRQPEFDHRRWDLIPAYPTTGTVPQTRNAFHR